MNRVWANRLEAGTKTWAECPESRRNGVNSILLQDVANGLISEEQYRKIIEDL